MHIITANIQLPSIHTLHSPYANKTDAIPQIHVYCPINYIKNFKLRWCVLWRRGEGWWGVKGSGGVGREGGGVSRFAQATWCLKKESAVSHRRGAAKQPNGFWFFVWPGGVGSGPWGLGESNEVYTVL